MTATEFENISRNVLFPQMVYDCSAVNRIIMCSAVNGRFALRQSFWNAVNFSIQYELSFRDIIQIFVCSIWGLRYVKRQNSWQFQWLHLATITKRYTAFFSVILQQFCQHHRSRELKVWHDWSLITLRSWWKLKKQCEEAIPYYLEML